MMTRIPGSGSEYGEEVEMGEVEVVGVLSLKLDSTRGCFCQVKQWWAGQVSGSGIQWWQWQRLR